MQEVMQAQRPVVAHALQALRAIVVREIIKFSQQTGAGTPIVGISKTTNHAFLQV